MMLRGGAVATCAVSVTADVSVVFLDIGVAAAGVAVDEDVVAVDIVDNVR